MTGVGNTRWIRPTALAIVLYFGAGALATIARPDRMPVSTTVLAVLIVTLGVTPAVRFMARSVDDRPVFPLFVLTGAFYALFFGFSAFTAEVLRDPETKKIGFYSGMWIDGIGTDAQALVVGGLVSMLAAYAVTRRPSLRLPRFRLPPNFDNRRMRIVFWMFLAGHLIYAALPALRGIASLGQFLQPAGFLAFAGFYIMWRRRELNRVEALLVLLALTLDFAFIVRSTSTLPVVLLATMLLILEWFLARRLPWILLLCFIIAAPALYMASQIVRGPLWMMKANVDLTDVPVAVFKTFRHWLVGQDRAPIHASNDKQLARILGATHAPELMAERVGNAHVGLARRVSHIALMEHVVANTPDRIPYWKGETYRPLLTSWIPRFLWPDKPREETGWSFGRRYGILKADDPPQSINLPWMIEMYANFGGAGVILGMGLVGVLFAFLEAFLSRPSMTPAEMAAGTAVILPLFMQDSNFSLMTGSIPLLILAFWIVLAVAAKIPLPSVLSKDRPGL